MIRGEYSIISLCDSTRKYEFMEVQKRFTLEGDIVISAGLFCYSRDYEVWKTWMKEH